MADLASGWASQCERGSPSIAKAPRDGRVVGEDRVGVNAEGVTERVEQGGCGAARGHGPDLGRHLRRDLLVDAEPSASPPPSS